MANANKLLIELANILEEEKRNVNLFYLTAGHTVTELYKTECYVEQLKAIIKKLNHLLMAREQFRKTTPIKEEKSTEYSRVINQIIVQFCYLIATNQAMNDNLKEINTTEELHYEIKYNLMNLKDKTNKTLKEIGNFLKA